jgi:hypothetical protein
MLSCVLVTLLSKHTVWMCPMSLLTQRYERQIAGMLSCFDRVIISGTLPELNYARGMTSYLYSKNIRIFDYAKAFAEPLRDRIRECAQTIAETNGINIEYIRSSKSFRKESRISDIIKDRGNHPGLVHIFSAMETCASFEPWHDKITHKTYLRYDEGKCLHYYFYFIDPELGLCYLRVPTWSPFRLQFYCNAHNWLANQLRKEGISFTQCDNTFVNIGDFQRAQAICDQFSAEILHSALERYSTMYCPVAQALDLAYYWSINQLEYATDIVFHRQSDLAPIYQTLVRTAIHSVKPDNVATFLSRKLHDNFADELGNDFHTRLEGTRIKHHMGPAAIKMYDKHQMVLRIETTVNDVSFFKHHRKVVHRDGTTEMKLAPVKKTIHSLGVLRELMSAANGRYIQFISDLDDPSAGMPSIEKLSASVNKNDRTYRGFNLFAPDDLGLFQALSRGEFNISGLRNSSLRRVIPEKTSSQISRLLKRLHLHGLIKKVGCTYKYYLTDFGRRVVISALKVRELVVIPSLAQA